MLGKGYLYNIPSGLLLVLYRTTHLRACPGLATFTQLLLPVGFMHAACMTSPIPFEQYFCTTIYIISIHIHTYLYKYYKIVFIFKFVCPHILNYRTDYENSFISNAMLSLDDIDNREDRQGERSHVLKRVVVNKQTKIMFQSALHTRNVAVRD